MHQEHLLCVTCLSYPRSTFSFVFYLCDISFEVLEKKQMVAVSSRANTFGSVFEKAAFTPIYVGECNGVYCAHNIKNVIQINLYQP